MKRASTLGVIGAALLVLSHLLQLAEIIYNINFRYTDYILGNTETIVYYILGMIFPISFTYLLYSIKKQL